MKTIGVIDSYKILSVSDTAKYLQQLDAMPRDLEALWAIMQQNSIDCLWVTPGSALSQWAKESPENFCRNDNFWIKSSRAKDGTPFFIMAKRERRAIYLYFPEHDARW